MDVYNEEQIRAGLDVWFQGGSDDPDRYDYIPGMMTAIRVTAESDDYSEGVEKTLAILDMHIAKARRNVEFWQRIRATELTATHKLVLAHLEKVRLDIEEGLL